LTAGKDSGLRLLTRSRTIPDPEQKPLLRVETMATATRKIIVRNGQEVWCYGAWKKSSSCSCVFEDSSFDGIYADGASSWTEAVEKLTAFAKKNGTVLEELVAC